MILPQRTSAPRHAVFYFDFGDPCCYLAAQRVPGLCRDHAVSLTLEPVDGRGLVGCGPGTSDPAAWEEVLHRAAAIDVPLRVPGMFPFDSRPLLKACVFVRDRSGQEAMAAVAERIWEAVWRSGADPNEPETIFFAARGAGIPEPVLRAGLADPRIDGMLARVTARARRHGVDTIPSVQVEGALFAGLDGLPTAEARVRGDGALESEGRDGGLPDWTFTG